VCGFNDDIGGDNCVDVVKNYKTVQVPCTRNTYKQYTVKVPRQVIEKVPRTVQYTDYENRPKQVPYTVNRQVQRTRYRTQTYQVPVPTQKIKMVPVTRKVPKVIYVNVTTNVPQQYTTTVMQNRERQVPEHYYVNVPETKYRTIMEQVPVTKSRVKMDEVAKTVYDVKVRTSCVPETKIISKQIPVYNVVPRPSQTCAPGVDYGGLPGNDLIGRSGDSNFNNVGVLNDSSDVVPPTFNNYLDTRVAGTQEPTCAQCF